MTHSEIHHIEPITVITGTSRGIGKGLAEYYLKKGHIVVGCSRGDFQLDSSRYRHFSLDVSEESAVKTLFEKVKKEFGRVDHLINNAAVAKMNLALLTPYSVLENSFKINTFGTYLFCREAARLMCHKKYGRIVNFATAAVPFRLNGESVYAASKAAVISLTEVLSREMAPHNVTVNVVSPPPIDTDLIKHVPKPVMDALVKRHAIQRKGAIEDVANVIDFFLKRESAMVTGQTIYLGGL